MFPSGFRARIASAQAGDREAFEEILREIQPSLTQWATQLLMGAAGEISVSDVTQVAGLAIWQNLNQFVGADSDELAWRAFLGWAKRIVRTRGLNHVRDMQRQRGQVGSLEIPPGRRDRDEGRAGPMAVDMSAADPSPSEAARSAEDARRVQDALATLPDEPDRLVVNMHFVQDLSLTEIAKALGLSFDEVRRVYRRSMRHLETLLADGEVQG